MKRINGTNRKQTDDKFKFNHITDYIEDEASKHYNENRLPNWIFKKTSQPYYMYWKLVLKK